MSELFHRITKGDEKANNDTVQNTTYTASVTATEHQTVVAGDLKYVGEQGGNNAPLAYQEANGAPVEVQSPLGYSVGPVTIIFLNISKM